MPARKVWEHAPPPRKILGMKLDNLLLNLAVVFEARRIKGVTPLQVTEAAKQLVIRVSPLILIAYRHS